MILGIEASNIRGGGGITHLKELLQAYDPSRYAFQKIIVWAGTHTLNQLPDTVWLKKETHPFLDKNIFFRLFWQRFLAAKEINQSDIHVLFVPGALHYLNFKPLVTMSHNMLPFEPVERNRYGFSYMKTRLQLLEAKQGKAFTDAEGVVFLTQYAKNTISARLNGKVKSSEVVAHGISPVFVHPPKVQKEMSAYSKQNPFELLYVSIIDVYKHQKNLVPAVLKLYNEGYPIRLKLVGPEYAPEKKLLDEVIQQQDPQHQVINFVGAIPYTDLKSTYHQADMFVFPSSCENLPNILIEAMASGLPIACSNKGPMPEVLQDGGEYFNPEEVESIYNALKKLLESAALRAQFAERSFALSKSYSWQNCADKTFTYLSSFV